MKFKKEKLVLGFIPPIKYIKKSNLVKRAFGTGFLKAINIRKINPKDVCLKPRF